ncbi:MAG: hypothetical protein U1F29_02360 [Planctomycetota bacterium]
MNILPNLLLVASAVFSAPSASIAEPRSASPAVEDANAVSTPSFPNSTCPIMGKPISSKLYVDTEKGRIWVCCKSCNKEVLADVAKAHQTAYPKITKLENELCPVTGKKIEKGAPRVVLQGFEFSVATKEAAVAAQADAQVVLARLNDPKLVDLGNTTCPVTGEAVGKNAFVVIGKTIVRLSSPKVLDDVQKDPAKILEKARALREKQGAAPGKT